MDCDLEQIVHATQELFEKLAPLTGKIDVPEEKIASFSDTRKEYQSGSSQYASADSSFGSDQPISVQRMSLGPTGT